MKPLTIQADELLADGNQVVMFLSQPLHGKIILEEDLCQEVTSYLQRYKEATVAVQFLIFLHYGLYPLLMERYIQTWLGDFVDG